MIKNALVGFLAAVIAVVAVHQVMILLLTMAGTINGRPWSFAPIAPFGVPALVNLMFWGGLWGALYGAVHPSIPIETTWLRGLLFGLLGPVLLGGFLLVPLIKGGALFAGFDAQRMLASCLINGPFGIAVALLFEQLRSRL